MKLVLMIANSHKPDTDTMIYEAEGITMSGFYRNDNILTIS